MNVFFRAESTVDGVAILRTIGADALKPEGYGALWGAVAHHGEILTSLVLAGAFLLVEWVYRRHEHPLQVERLPRPLRHLIYTLLAWAVLFFMPTTEANPFVYLQF